MDGDFTGWMERWLCPDITRVNVLRLRQITHTDTDTATSIFALLFCQRESGFITQDWYRAILASDALVEMCAAKRKQAGHTYESAL